MQLPVAYTLSESMLHDVMKLHNSRFSEETFHICTYKVQIPVVELLFFSSNTPILKKWIMLPQNVLHINHSTWTMKLITHFNLVIRSGMHTTLPTNTHTHTHTHTHTQHAFMEWNRGKSVIVIVENSHQTQALNVPHLGYLPHSKQLLHVLKHTEWWVKWSLKDLPHTWGQILHRAVSVPWGLHL